MRKADERIKYTCQGYRYAPESFMSFKVIIDPSGNDNHQYIKLNFTAEQEKKIGYVFITQGRQAAGSLAKRYDRQREQRKKNYITYGFLDANDPSTYHFTCQLYCRLDAPLHNRLALYKNVKALLREERSYAFTEATLGAGFKPENIKKKDVVYRINADLTKPVVVYLRAT